MGVLKSLYDWLVLNRTNIIAGIVASLIVLALQVLSRAASIALAAWLTLRWRLRLLWGLKDPQRVYIVSGAITGVTETVKSVILAGPDAEAASTLVATLGLLYPGGEVRHMYSSTFPPESYKDHLIIVGGPKNNGTCAALLKQLGPDISFNEELELTACGGSYSATYDEHDSPTKDFGAIIRVDNPFDKSKGVVIAMGCDTYGTLAAAMLISARREAKEPRAELQKRLGLRRYFRQQNYVAIVECDVLGNDIGRMWLKDFHLLKT